MRAPTKEEIARVMALVQPTRERERCREDVISSIKLIATTISTSTPRGALKRQLGELATAMTNAQAAIKKIPQRWRRCIFLDIEADDLLHHLNLVAQTSVAQAEKISVRRSGGARRARIEATMKRIAVRRAFDLLNDWGGPPPTSTKSGRFSQLASLLYELATGSPEKDMNRLCTRYLKKLEADGYPNAATRQRWRRIAKGPNARP